MLAVFLIPHFLEGYPLVKTLALCQYVVMVCLYCGQETEVTNSRPKAKTPSVWRRRACKVCVAQFTTIELPDYATALVVKGLDGQTLTPFNRDRLFLSIYKSLGHRPDAMTSATALVTTIIGKMLSKKLGRSGALQLQDIVKVTYEVLRHFDLMAATSYKAYHQKSLQLTVNSRQLRQKPRDFRLIKYGCVPQQRRPEKMS